MASFCRPSPKRLAIRTLGADFQPHNLGLNLAWKYAQDREHWKHLVETATLQLGARAWWWWWVLSRIIACFGDQSVISLRFAHVSGGLPVMVIELQARNWNGWSAIGLQRLPAKSVRLRLQLCVSKLVLHNYIAHADDLSLTALSVSRLHGQHHLCVHGILSCRLIGPRDSYGSWLLIRCRRVSRDKTMTTWRY